MNRFSRRQLLKTSMCASLAAALPWSRIHGANADIRMAIVGLGSHVKLGGKGRGDLLAFRKIPGVRVVAVCDCDAALMQPVVKQCAERHEPVRAYKDVRALLNDKNIDAISISTPNHWHSLMAIWACQAGKDVFIQKPASHHIFEGRKMVEAARKYGRVVQATHGMRSNGAIAAAFEYARRGKLGKVLYVHGVNYKPRKSIGKVSGPQPIPSTCDYDLWSGPAPMEPLGRRHLHYDWHWDWDTGNGDLGNMGIHFMDSCRWAVQQQTLPRRAISIGGRFGYDDDGETPNTLISFFDYEPAPILFEVRGLPRSATFQDRRWGSNMDTYRGKHFGAIVHCENGYVVGGEAYDSKGNLIKKFDNDRTSTKENFIAAVRSRRTSDLDSEALEGHLSCGLVHMANISYRLGKQIPSAQTREVIREKKPLMASFERLLGHLEANGIDLTRTPAALGPMLEFDPHEERFTGPYSVEANRLVARTDRKPFVVPEKV